MAINLIITDAGRAQLINASNTGTNLITLSHVAFGWGKNVSTADQTELQNEFKRLSTISGSAVADDTLHVMISDDTTANYAFSEFGLFTNTGVLFAVYSQATNIMNKTSVASLRLAVDIVLETLDAAQVVFGDTNFLNPPATTITAGVAKIALQSETVAGINNQKIITPLRLQHKVNQLLDGVSASFNTFKKIEGALQQSTTLKKGTAKIATQSLTGTGVDNQSIITPLLLKWRVNQLLDNVGTSFNTFKKIAMVLVEKLGKTEKAANSAKLNGVVNSSGYVANSIAQRDVSADIKARLFRSNYTTQTWNPPLSAQVLMRNSLQDDYLRPVSKASFLNYLGHAVSKSASGYQKLTGGLIIQWGSTPLIGAQASATVVFPVAFPVRCAVVMLTMNMGINQGGDKRDAWNTFSKSRASFGVTNRVELRSSSYDYMAIGY